MAQTLALQTRGFRTGRLDFFSRLDFTRISAEAGAIAINGVALLLLLAPMSVHVPPAEQRIEDIVIVPVKPEQPPIPPVKPKQVEISRPRVVPTTPPDVPQKVEVQRIPIVDPLHGDLPADPVQVAKVGPGDAIAEPLAGAHLEYQIAPPPPYPVEAIRGSLTGTVMLRVLVDVNGKPIDVRIERSSGHRVLDAAARKQVLAKWRFRPAMQDGRAVQAIGMVPVDFHLDR